MHGSYRYDPRIIGNLATEARQRVKDGLLKTPYNGAMFWAFRMASSGQDRNINLLNAFRDAAAKTGGVVYQSLRDLKSYPKLQDGLGIPEIADIYSRGFAQGVSGETITVAADDSNPHDYFIRSELPILLDNPDLKSVRRLMPHPDDAEGITGLFQEKVYGSVADWLYEQRQQWFESSIARTEMKVEQCLSYGGRYVQTLYQVSDVEKEIQGIQKRLNAQSYLFHEQNVHLRILDKKLYEQGTCFIKKYKFK